MGDDAADGRPTPPPGPRAGRGHIPALDGLRGLAILMVLVFHQSVMHPATALDRAVLRLTGHLNAGVDLFFVLSGFLITGILLDARGEEGYFRNFFARRALRIFPLYYAVLFGALVVLPGLPHPKRAKWAIDGSEQLWYWLYLSNWRIGRVGFRHGVLDVSWSLAIEEQFYLAWPFAVALLGRRALIGACLGLIAAAFASRAALLALGGPEMGVHTFTTSRMDTLAVGALIALIARGPGGLAALTGPARWVAAGAGGVVVAGAAWAPAVGGAIGAAGHSAYYSATAAAFGALLVLAVAAPPASRAARLLGGRVLATFGAYSYALYLFHYPILGVIRDAAYGPDRFPTVLGSPLPGQLLFYVAATLPALGGAWLSWHLFEKHFLKLKRHFVPAPRGAGAKLVLVPEL